MCLACFELASKLQKSSKVYVGIFEAPPSHAAACLQLELRTLCQGALVLN